MKKNKLPPNFPRLEHAADAPPWFLLTPAYTVLPLVRGPLGRNLVLPKDSFLHAISLIFFPTAIAWFRVAFTARPLPESVGLRFMWYFAELHLAASLVVFARRWWGQSHREHVHTAEHGHSFAAWYLPLNSDFCERILVPGAVAAIGYVLAHSGVSQALGWWLIICAASLMVLSGYENGMYWTGERDAVDAMSHAQADEERMKRYESVHGSSQNNHDDKPDFADLN